MYTELNGKEYVQKTEPTDFVTVSKLVKFAGDTKIGVANTVAAAKVIQNYLDSI